MDIDGLTAPVTSTSSSNLPSRVAENEPLSISYTVPPSSAVDTVDPTSVSVNSTTPAKGKARGHK
jgi:hypothetical protein